MSDTYLAAIQDQWPYIRSLYMAYQDEMPIILYDIDEKKVYAYPYKEFKEELSGASQAALQRDYKSASALGKMVVFVRDNTQQRLVSYVMDPS